MVPAKKILGAVAALAAAVLVLAGCSSNGDNSGGSGSSGGASSGGTFNIYFDAGLTGSLSGNAKAQQAGITAAVDQLNADGGILGHKVVLKTQDDGGDPTKALTLLTQYMDNTTPNLVIPGQTSDQALALLPTLTRSKILSIGLPNSSKLNNPSTYPYEFATNTLNSNDASALASTLKQKGYTSVGLLASNDALGQDISTTYTQVLEKAGIKVTLEQFNDTDVDFTPHLQRLEAAKPQALVLAAFGPAVGYTLKARTQLDISTPLVASTVTGDGINLGLVSGPQNWNGVTVLMLKVNSTDIEQNAGLSDLQTQLKKDGVTINQLMEQYTFAWDQVYLAAYAAQQANSISGADMAKALENFKAPSDSKLITLPTYKYSSTNHFVETTDSNYILVPAGGATNGLVSAN